jgi:peptidoglycan biosynthesis protein MviN/MurJ (putative lipid II flippase)
MIANFIGAFAFFLVAAFTPFIGLWLNNIAIASLVWVAGGLSAVMLAYRRKELARILLGGSWKIPLVAIVGAMSMVLMLVNFYWDVSTPAIGPSTPQADAILVTIFIVGLVVYFVSYSIRKRQGIDLNLIYSEIPPE